MCDTGGLPYGLLLLSCGTEPSLDRGPIVLGPAALEPSGMTVGDGVAPEGSVGSGRLLMGVCCFLSRCCASCALTRLSLLLPSAFGLLS